MGGAAHPSILAVVLAPVSLAPLATVTGRAVTLGLLVGVKEAATTIPALQAAGPSRRRWRHDRR